MLSGQHITLTSNMAITSTLHHLHHCYHDTMFRWETLEEVKDTVVTTRAWADTSKVNKASYPSSSKKKKDWDKLTQEVKKEEEEEKPEGDAALNKLFQVGLHSPCNPPSHTHTHTHTPAQLLASPFRHCAPRARLGVWVCVGVGGCVWVWVCG